RDQNRAELFRRLPHRLQPAQHFPPPKAGIDQNARPGGRNHGRVAAAAAAQDGERDRHGSSIEPRGAGPRTIFPREGGQLLLGGLGGGWGRSRRCRRATFARTRRLALLTVAVGGATATLRLALRLRRGRGARLLGVVGHVPARSFELDGGGGQQFFQRTTARLALGQGSGAESLNLLHALVAARALIFVQRHGETILAEHKTPPNAATLRQSPRARWRRRSGCGPARRRPRPAPPPRRSRPAIVARTPWRSPGRGRPAAPRCSGTRRRLPPAGRSAHPGWPAGLPR